MLNCESQLVIFLLGILMESDILVYKLKGSHIRAEVAELKPLAPLLYS
uniref:Uncharacterized protein n=1 Tax=Nelumbo nucifera TaxID=4432 RepID=A0A822ZPV4_NELNU|nr:TPA_asm: hypothetical protein HUJ06_016447 [Nelumbo nucifera]